MESRIRVDSLVASIVLVDDDIPEAAGFTYTEIDKGALLVDIAPDYESFHHIASDKHRILVSSIVSSQTKYATRPGPEHRRIRSGNMPPTDLNLDQANPYLYLAIYIGTTHACKHAMPYPAEYLSRAGTLTSTHVISLY